MRTPPPSLVAALSLIAGFAVADVSGVRPLGGVVLFAGALWCGLRWKARRGLPTAAALIAVYLALFALSHPLGHEIGAWPSVVVVAAAMGAAGWWCADRRPARSEQREQPRG
jgi:hypothetical protein